MKAWVVVAVGVAGVVLGALTGSVSGRGASAASTSSAVDGAVVLPFVGVGASFEIHPTGFDLEQPGLMAF